MELEPSLHHEPLPFQTTNYRKKNRPAVFLADLTLQRLQFFCIVVAIVNSTLVIQAAGNFMFNQSIKWLAPVLSIYLVIIACWLLARSYPALALALLHLLLLLITGCAVHLAGGALSVSGAYYVFLAVVTGLLVLGSNAGLILSITCGIAYLVLGSLELAGIIPVTNSVFEPLYTQGFNLLAMSQMTAAGTIVLFAAALSRLIAISMHRDIREKSELYSAAEQSRLEWEATFAAITDGISVHDKSLTIVHANPALAGILGIGIDELEGQPGEAVFSGWFGDPSPLKECLAKNKMLTFQVDMPPGCFGNYRITTYPVNTTENRVIGVVQIIQDITQEKQIQSQLIQTEKIAALGRMVSSLSHEINNPLQAIRSGLGLLKKQKLDQEKRDKYLDVACSEVDRLIAITERLLNFDRPPSSQVVSTDLNQVINEVLSTVKKTLQDRGVRPVTRLNKIPRLELAADQIKQVFVNLALNSMDALPQGGDLIISTTCELDKSNMPMVHIVFSTLDHNGASKPVHGGLAINAWNGKGSGLAATCRTVEAIGGSITQSDSTQKVAISIPLKGR